MTSAETSTINKSMEVPDQWSVCILEGIDNALCIRILLEEVICPSAKVTHPRHNTLRVEIENEGTKKYFIQYVQWHLYADMILFDKTECEILKIHYRNVIASIKKILGLAA